MRKLGLWAALAAAGVTAATAGPCGAEGSSPDAAAFYRENEAAMKTMMQDMHAPPSGDVDRDFIVMMAPHHQGAIDMCAALLRHGANPELKRLCGEIIAKQQEEIDVMRRVLAQLPAPPADRGAAASAGHAHHAHH